MITTISSLLEALKRFVGRAIRPRRQRRPRFPLFNSGDPNPFTAPDDELLKGFGER